MKLEDLIKEKHTSFTEGEIAIARYLLNHTDDIPKMNINQLAKNSLTSKSSVLRLAQKLGFSGFTELKNFLKWGNFFSENPITHSELGDLISESINKTIENFKSMNLDNIHQAIDESEHIYLIGTGLSQQSMAAQMQRIFLGLGKEMQVLPIGMQTTLYQIMIERMGEKDLLIVFSGSGNNPVLKEELTTPILKNVKILGITSNGNSWLANQSTYSIKANFNIDHSISNLISLSSPFNVIIELLAYSYIKYKNL
jgi:RpiR family transcriptional regulator, glv operon transcriptional regulator